MQQFTLHVLKLLLTAALCTGPAWAEPPSNPAPDDVDVALVLAVDVSSSIERTERHFQRQAYAEALRDPRVVRLALGGRTGRVAIAYMEWSGRRFQKVHLPMRVLSTPAELSDFADDITAIHDTPNDPMYLQPTALGNALLAAGAAMRALDVTARDYIIDISGDGVLNDGFGVQSAREEVLASGLIVNGLPIELAGNPMSHDSESAETVSRYYEDCVIGGPGAFHLVARGFGDIRETLIMKLMLEMAHLPPQEKQRIASLWNRDHLPPRARIVPVFAIELAPQTPAPRRRTDCTRVEGAFIIP
ncbi:MAG: DUF1194 domain-containing protein [Pseudomonadota bacterium]